MCVFTGPVGHVAGTKILARALPSGEQVLVYEMRFAADADLAMVLPLPVPLGVREDAVRFVSLEGQEDFFERLDDAFPARDLSLAPAGFGPPQALAPRPLVVHDVGAFEASFVPTSADFARLDPRFRLSPELLAALPGVADPGFAVFRLRGGASPRRVHPMALVFPRRHPRELFFPTVHVHDGTVPAVARFDHSFYAQPDDATAALLDWERSDGPVGAHVPATAARVLDLARPVFRSGLGGPHDNRDVVLTAPLLSDPSALEIAGAHHHLRLRTGLPFRADGRCPAAWRRVVLEALPAFSAALGSALDDALADLAARLRLAPWRADLRLQPIHQPPGAKSPPGACRIELWTHGGGVEMQCFSVAFADPPPLAATQELHRAFVRALEAAMERCADVAGLHGVQ